MKPRPTPTSPKQQTLGRELEELYRVAPTITRPQHLSASAIVALVAGVIVVTLSAFVGLRGLAERFPDIRILQYFRSEILPGERIVIREERQNANTTNIDIERVKRSLGVLLKPSPSGPSTPDDRLGLVVFLSNDGVGLTLKANLPKKPAAVIGQASGERVKILKQTADSATPLSLFKVDGQTVSMSFADLERLVPGDEVVVVRHDPFNGGLGVLHVRIASTRDRLLAGSSLSALLESSEVLTRRIRLDRTLDPTWDGAAVIDRDARLIGIVDASSTRGGQATVVPIEPLRNQLSGFTRHGEIRRPLLGVSYLDLAFAAPLPDRPSKGAYLMAGEQGKPPAVLPRSPAAVAGLRPEDVITGVEDVVVTDARSLSELLLSYDPGSKLVVHILRNRSPLDITVTLGEATAGS